MNSEQEHTARPCGVQIGKGLCFFFEECAWPGVRRTADNVRRDIELVTGFLPRALPWQKDRPRRAAFAVLYGTAGRSALLDRLEAAGKIDLAAVRGKREVYLFQVVQDPLPGIGAALVIAGSDKRGAIYGLYHLSEKLGVSPFVNWNHVWPAKRDHVWLTAADNCLSKEPSVRYRGFFINDE